MSLSVTLSHSPVSMLDTYHTYELPRATVGGFGMVIGGLLVAGGVVIEAPVMLLTGTAVMAISMLFAATTCIGGSGSCCYTETSGPMGIMHHNSVHISDSPSWFWSRPFSYGPSYWFNRRALAPSLAIPRMPSCHPGVRKIPGIPSVTRGHGLHRVNAARVVPGLPACTITPRSISTANCRGATPSQGIRSSIGHGRVSIAR